LFYTPVYEADGRVGGVMCTCIDNSARIALERGLATSNARFRTAMEAMHGVLWTNSPDGRMVGEQPAWAALTGQSEAQYRDFGWAEAVHPDDRAPTIEAWNAAVANRTMFVHEHRVRRQDGAWRRFAIRALPIIDDVGTILEWVGVHSDITHQRAAEEALRELNANLEARVVAEIDERRKAEAKLAQAQKMESIGKLTGGVAHDFNNLLQVISGNLQLLALDVAGNDRAETRIANAIAGVSRGSKLAAQLLAFGRRQALEPKVVNISRLVRNMDDMLRRAIGEGVEVETIVGGGLWNSYIDTAQIENALLNLAINARDAMDGQGKLTIELGNAHLDADYADGHDEVTAGQYVMLAVSDTGCGMDAALIEKVFEPFFSTKGEGKGSGLGLSMVYGFVKQSGGHVKIYSEVGEGTTIKLYLPRSMESEDIEVHVETGPIVGGTETVLVVEDDEEVRVTVVEMLSDLGYRVLKAGDAGAALNVIESGMPIDILFTDVVMPGTLKSPELARKARERLPGIAVLFTSGYTENSIVHGGKLDAGVELLSKPYTREALARRLRHVLANQRQRDTGTVRPAGDPIDPMVSPTVRAADPSPLPALGQLLVLVVEDDALICLNTAEMLRDRGYGVVEAGSAEEAMAILESEPIDVLVSDVNLPGCSGLELAEQARGLRSSLAIVFASGDTAAVIGTQGATILAKPYNMGELDQAVKQAMAQVPTDGRVTSS
ncbi:hybrid sensor histidine kinase/response regulator, partial [Sphingobium phenoxybenzoativorans]|uniref:hybrid sensor histidine kinase/response regulator n=1 Tax=Sphingobium phenoxybenzoativorans TaxID=1592790 RepID=UPI000A4D5079